MTDQNNEGGPAFPVATIDGAFNRGMSLRQWYAGMAMQAILSHQDSWSNKTGSSWAFVIADAMIKAAQDND